ncbi:MULTISPECIES: YopX family protein [Rhodococcus]|uniref:YopX family protein n=1 Tax=Rhodococcus TaxID=1827 RepID=UPI000691EFD6|nr:MULTISPECIES: YopX family protein [Rhodococcus]MCJ0950352.1 YopX family protein [Rhodococcus sp. ARC_M8]QEX10887.1 hypothetical protein F6X56_14765 [Rhodococcus erythropolis]UKO88900.1 YopX family protein [Rhodococcus erythropolis]BBE45485.1 hypothetical protein RE2895_24160 [Rhodococcus erythropolis]
MSEIKLRAWDGKRFVYFTPFTLIIDSVEGEGLLDNISTLYDLVRKDPDFKFDRFTGQKDKNGVEIYEGDLIRHYAVKAEIGSVHFGKYVTGNESNEDILGWIVHFPMNAEALDPQLDWEVTGNIHENPELLEVTS